MRLWHERLLPHLPRQQLLGQHREAAALRGNGWNKPHRTVNYVFEYSPVYLYVYHLKVIAEMEHRGYRVEPKWKNLHYRGLNCEPYSHLAIDPAQVALVHQPVFKEHNDDYLQECIDDLTFFRPLLIVLEVVKTCGIPIILGLAAITATYAAYDEKDRGSFGFVHMLLQLSTILSTNFELVHSLLNPLVYATGDTLDILLSSPPRGLPLQVTSRS